MSIRSKGRVAVAYKLTNADGFSIVVENLREFCETKEELKINSKSAYTCLNSIANKNSRNRTYKGWRAIKFDLALLPNFTYNIYLNNQKGNTLSSFNRYVPQRATNAAGTVVPKISNEKQLTRLVLANMLFSDQYYVDGKTTVELVKDLVAKTNEKFVSHLALAARSNFKLRHIPLLLTRELARTGRLSADVLASVVQRADEMGDFLSLYWSEGKTPISNQVKKGLAKAFGKFNEYQLAKYDRNNAAIRIRDVMFLTHAKPANEEQAALFKKVADQKLKTPNTWETRLSSGEDKREVFEDLMRTNQLGALAFLRNLRNMVEAGIPESTLRAYGATVNVSKVLPFRYIAAARIVPRFEDMLETMMLRSLEGHKKLSGKTKVVIDVSDSMFGTEVSAKSDLDRFDAAGALAMLLREICEEVEIYSFSYDAVRVPARRGFALVEAINNSQRHGGTYLGKALQTVGTDYDRIIVLTDEQSYDRPAAPANGKPGYILNVGSYQNGVNHDAWTTITGFSEAVVDYIQALESEEDFGF